MSSYKSQLTWRRGDQVFSDGKYSRGHEIAFDGGITMPASSAPQVVRPPLSREDAVDPEEMLVASLSSCHALFFLDFARRGGFILDAYIDEAEGILEKRADGKMAITKVTLRPNLTWSGDNIPSSEQVAAMHHQAHELCFIANSFNGEVVIES